MKKFLPLVVVIVLVAGATAAFFLTKKGTTLVTSSPEPQSNSSGSYKLVDACKALTQADANMLLGATATKADTSIGDTSSADIDVSTCSYSIATPITSLTLLARSARTAAGAVSNNAQFTTGLPGSAQDITGFGDAAYWDPTYGQLNILKHNNWYILSSGGLKPSDKSLAGAKAFAKRILSRL